MRLLFILFFLSALPAVAQTPPDTVYGYGYLTPPDRDTLTTRPGEAEWQQLTADNAFAVYKDTVEFREVAREEQKARRGAGFLAAILHFFASAAGKVLLFLLIFFLMGWLAFRWVKNKGGGLFYNNKKFHSEASETAGPEDLTQDWALRTEQAVQQQDYRLAIRFGYLHLLQLLDDQGYIDYHPNQTNRAYAAQLQASEVRESFLKVTRRYELSWYGYQPTAAADYVHFRQLSETFKTKIKA